MTQDFLPVPLQLPSVPDSVEQIALLGTVGNQHAGCGMFGRAEGSTLTELQQCCEAHLPTYIGRKMPLSTANQTKDKLRNHWRWRQSGVCCSASKSGEMRGGEPVYRIVEDATTEFDSTRSASTDRPKVSASKNGSAQKLLASAAPNRPRDNHDQRSEISATLNNPRPNFPATHDITPPADMAHKKVEATLSDQQAFNEEYMTSTEAMQLLGISRAGFLYGRRSGKLPEPISLNEGRLIVWKRGEVMGPLLAWKQVRKVSR